MMHLEAYVRGVALLGLLLAFGGCDQGTEPGPLATKLQVSGVPAEAQTTIPLSAPPVVQATDDQGRAASASTTVTVEVISGSGTIMTGQTAATDASGRATFTNLTLGASGGAVGPVSLRFSAPGLEPATATVMLRCALLPVQLGQTVSRSLTTGDCAFVGDKFYNDFELTTSQPVTAVFLNQDAEFRPVLAFRGPNEPLFYWGIVGEFFNTAFGIALLPAGKTRIATTSSSAGVTGSYTFSAAAVSEDVKCIGASVASPITTTQSLAQGDCFGDGFFEDYFYIGLPISATLTASMAAQAFTPALTLKDFAGAQVATGTGQASAALTFVNNSGLDQAYYLTATSASAGGAGVYTLSISVTYPPATGASAAIRFWSRRSERWLPTRGGRTHSIGPALRW